MLQKKLPRSVAKIKKNELDCLYLGNLNARRDWGYAKEYVELMWLMLQHDTPDDFVAASGKSHSIREFVELAFEAVDMNIVWEGEGLEEVGIIKESGKVVVSVDEKYFRPAEVEFLLEIRLKQKIFLDGRLNKSQRVGKSNSRLRFKNDSYGGEE